MTSGYFDRESFTLEDLFSIAYQFAIVRAKCRLLPPETVGATHLDFKMNADGSLATVVRFKAQFIRFSLDFDRDPIWKIEERTDGLSLCVDRMTRDLESYDWGESENEPAGKRNIEEMR